MRITISKRKMKKKNTWHLGPNEQFFGQRNGVDILIRNRTEKRIYLKLP